MRPFITVGDTTVNSNFGNRALTTALTVRLCETTLFNNHFRSIMQNRNAKILLDRFYKATLPAPMITLPLRNKSGKTSSALWRNSFFDQIDIFFLVKINSLQ